MADVQKSIDAKVARSTADDLMQFSRGAPKGSRVYLFDQYQIRDGSNFTTVPIYSTFHRDLRGLHVTDLVHGVNLSFSPSATVTRQNNVGVTIVKPGEALTPELQKALPIGAARLVRVVSYQSEGPEDICPQTLIDCVGGGSKQWGRRRLRP